jgi:DNA-binding NarL/FixJ family response regulator
MNLKLHPGTPIDTSVLILIVDDQEFVRKSICGVLQSRTGFKVCGEASNGEEAVQKAIQLIPALIVMDVSMPIMDGLCATRLIKKILPQIKILIISVQDSGALIRASQAAGANGFVSKDDVFDGLLNAADAVLQNHTSFPVAHPSL